MILPFRFRCIIYLYWSWDINWSKGPISFLFSILVPNCPSTIFEKKHLCLLAILSKRICHPAARSAVRCQPQGAATFEIAKAFKQKPSSSHAAPSQWVSMGGVLRPDPFCPLRDSSNELFIQDAKTFTIWGSPCPILLSLPFKRYPPINLLHFVLQFSVSLPEDLN